MCKIKAMIILLGLTVCVSCSESNKQEKAQKLKVDWVSTTLEPTHDHLYLSLVETIRIVNPKDDTISLSLYENESVKKSSFSVYNSTQKDSTRYIIKNSDGNIKINPLDTVFVTLVNFEYAVKINSPDSVVYLGAVKENLMQELRNRKLYIDLSKSNKITREIMPENNLIPQAKEYSVTTSLSDSLILSVKTKFKPPTN